MTSDYALEGRGICPLRRLRYPRLTMGVTYDVMQSVLERTITDTSVHPTLASCGWDPSPKVLEERSHRSLKHEEGVARTAGHEALSPQRRASEG